MVHVTTMPRKKGYEREVLVARARDVFHRRGYKGASTELLVQALGVNRNSMYAEFGSKAGLFGAAVDHYSSEVLPALFGALEAPGATLDDIDALFRIFAASAEDARGLGCLLCNTATELGGEDPALQPHVERYLGRLEAAFRNALDGAVRAGQIPAETDLAAEARFLVASCLGIFVMVRAGVESVVARGAVHGALAHLKQLRDVPSQRRVCQ